MEPVKTPSKDALNILTDARERITTNRASYASVSDFLAAVTLDDAYAYLIGQSLPPSHACQTLWNSLPNPQVPLFSEGI